MENGEAGLASWPSDVNLRDIAFATDLKERIIRARENADNININQVLDLLRILTQERKDLYEALKRVQGRCTDKEMERRELVAENKKLRATIDTMVEKLGCEE